MGRYGDILILQLTKTSFVCKFYQSGVICLFFFLVSSCPPCPGAILRPNSQCYALENRTNVTNVFFFLFSPSICIEPTTVFLRWLYFLLKYNVLHFEFECLASRSRCWGFQNCLRCRSPCSFLHEWRCLKGVHSLSDPASVLSDPASVVTSILLKAIFLFNYLCANLLLLSLSCLHWY